MLNNLTNFFNLIVGRRIKTQLEDSDLIAIGTKQSPGLGDYKPTAIRAIDLFNQISSQINVDVKYSNVIFVDAINGTNTAVLNDFTKSVLNVGSAGLIASTFFPGKTLTNRALVYVRRGYYKDQTITLYDNVDYYFEPGAYLTNSVKISDNGVTVNSNIYGSVKIDNTANVTMFEISGDSVVTFEFDTITSIGAAWYVRPTGTKNKITINGNYVVSTTLGQGWGIGFRNACNAVVNIKYAIEATHSVVMWRFFTGNVTVNCPNINLLAGNLYGGSNKQALVIYDAVSTGKITVNGNINNLDPIDYGGIGSLITFWSAPNTKFTLNGNASGGVIKALDGNTYASGLIEINGNLSSSNLYTAWLYGNSNSTGEIVIKNSVIINTNQTGSNFAISIGGSTKTFLKDCYISCTKEDTSIIQINVKPSFLVIDDCQLYVPGTSVTSFSVTSTVGGVDIRAKNSISNKPTSVDITNIYAPQGTLEVNANVINPTSIN